MALKDIFKMTKANRYTADGREELIKAQEAETEDRRYNIGEISEKTGLQKTANGWVKPKGGAERNHGTEQKKRGPGAIHTPGKGNVGMDKMKEAAEKGLKGQELKEFMTGSKSAGVKENGPLSPAKRKAERIAKMQKETGKAAPYGRTLKGTPKTPDDNPLTERTQKRAEGSNTESKPAEKLPAKPTRGMSESYIRGTQPEKKQSLKLPDEKSSFSTDVNRMKKLKKEDYKQYTIQLEKLHSKYPINKWKDLYDKTLNDEAPRVLTGDTRIRVRKA